MVDNKGREERRRARSRKQTTTTTGPFSCCFLLFFSSVSDPRFSLMRVYFRSLTASLVRGQLYLRFYSLLKEPFLEQDTKKIQLRGMCAKRQERERERTRIRHLSQEYDAEIKRLPVHFPKNWVTSFNFE